MPITASTPLELLRAVANSYHELEAREEGSTEGRRWLPAHDHLDTSESALDFLHRSGVRLSDAPQARHLARLREIRAAARALVENRRSYERRTARLLSRLRFRLDTDGRLRAMRAGRGGFVGRVMAPPGGLGVHIQGVHGPR